MLNKLLPEALEDSQPSTTGEKDVPVSLLTYLLVPPSSLDAELKRGALHWMLNPIRCAQWLKSLDEADMEDAPITGTVAEAAPALQRRIIDAASKLTAAERTLSASDVLYDTPLLDNPLCNTYYDFLLWELA